jgi:[acyl-carrier-protein] S-malonyltransferase
MQEAVPSGQGAMAALIGGSNEATQELCREAISIAGGACELANYNGGGQVVISGAKAAVEKAVQIAGEKKELGIRRAVLLAVSAPFHSSLMSPAAEKLWPFLQKMEVAPLQIPYIANVDAKVYSDSKMIRENLKAQVASSVRWEQSMGLLPGLSVSKAFEIGPGKVLAGLLRRIVKEVDCASIELPNN